VREAFYERDGDLFRATELTRGPWDPGSQHAGPPSALLAREVELLEDAAAFQVGRLTFEILRPVPIGPVGVRAEVARPGRRVQMLEAELTAPEGEPRIKARGWRVRTASLDLPAELIDLGEPPSGPEQGSEPEFFRTGQDAGYHTAMEWRALEGGFLEAGPAKFWMRQTVPLVAGEEPSPLQRTMAIADVGNGISAVLDPREHLFINVDLTVHLERMPEGEWVRVDAVTRPRPNGVGSAESELSDRRGRIGRAVQTLLFAER
jgi:Acyl-CoA thioesterase C-terminal domain/Acyl-CoA thioesterase N-terminal domain